MPITDLSARQRDFLRKYLVATPDGAASTEAASGGGDAGTWTDIGAVLADKVADLAASGHPDAAKIRKAWASAVTLAGSGRHAEALKIADRLEQILDAATPARAAVAGREQGGGTATGEAAAVIPEGTVRKRSFMVERWKKVPGELKLGIDALAGAVPDIAPWEDAGEISGLVRTHLGGLVDRMQGDIAASFDKDVSAGDGRYGTTLGTIRDLRAQIGNEPLLVELRKGIVVSGTAFVDAFEHALDEIETTLAS